jgi:exopolysaccharide/PEP-CTERM locus tyrosine autokinase
MSIIEKAASKLERAEKAHITQAPEDRLPAPAPEPDATPNESVTARDEVQIPLTVPKSKQIEIDLAKLRQMGGITPNEEKTQIVEEFRIIKRPLITNAFNPGAGRIRNGNLIMVTSALAGEGKSFCSINLAISIAMEMDHTVLLVDADVARPSLPRYLGVQDDKGLMDVLLDDTLELAEVIHRTNIEKLTLLTAGRKSRHSTELLASQNMSALLKEVAQRYDDRIIIFDSPPLLLTSESHVLASQMGQIVLVVEAETTTQKTVLEALRQIESCDSVNLIFNKARTFPGGDYYGYYYS